MRIIFVGATKVAVETAKALIEHGHEVIITEMDKAKIDDLSETLDCSFLHGDGTQPNMLSEVNPTRTDFLFCLTDSDQDNVIGSLVGRSLGFKRVVTSIGDPQFENICSELGLKDTISPSRTISRYLEDMVGGGQVAELWTVLKHEARLYMFTAKEEDAGATKDLELPEGARVVWLYRADAFSHADENTSIRAGDEVVILTHSNKLPALQERWSPKPQDKGAKT